MDAITVMFGKMGVARWPFAVLKIDSGSQKAIIAVENG